MRDRIEDLRSRARGDVASVTPAPSPSSSATSAATTAPRSAPAPVTTPAPAARSTTTTTATAGSLEIPVGTEIDVRLQNSLSSGTAQVEDRFEATTVADVLADGSVAIPSGAVVRGVVTAVEPGTRTNRTAKMTVSFDQVTVNGRSYPIRGTVTQAIEGEGIRGEAGTNRCRRRRGCDHRRDSWRFQRCPGRRPHRRRRHDRRDRRQGSRAAARLRPSRQTGFARPGRRTANATLRTTV